ncbi:MAG: hypothetical protein HY698_17555 [Deltaproteobacteria bacterium]|nr:hypothetical protein [Deltaproteobacteria bacterium]
MPRWQRTYIVACTLVIAYSLGYLIVPYARIPHLYYYPHERVFRLGVRGVGSLPSGYVGLWLWALMCSLLATAAVVLLLRIREKPLSERALGLGLAWTVTSFLLAGCYTTWNNWP